MEALCPGQSLTALSGRTGSISIFWLCAASLYKCGASGTGSPGKCQLSGSQAHVTETSPMEISKAGLEGRVWAL